MTEYLILVCSVNNLYHSDNVKLYNNKVISNARGHIWRTNSRLHWRQALTIVFVYLNPAIRIVHIPQRD